MIFSFFKQSLIHSYLYYLFCKWPKAERGSIGGSGNCSKFHPWSDDSCNERSSDHVRARAINVVHIARS